MPFLGLGVCFLSSLLMASSNVVVKCLQSTNPIVLVCVRFLIMSLLASPIVVQTDFGEGIRPTFRDYFLMTVRSIISTINILIKYYALQVK